MKKSFRFGAFFALVLSTVIGLVCPVISSAQTVVTPAMLSGYDAVSEITISLGGPSRSNPQMAVRYDDFNGTTLVNQGFPINRGQFYGYGLINDPAGLMLYLGPYNINFGAVMTTPTVVLSLFGGGFLNAIEVNGSPTSVELNGPTSDSLLIPIGSPGSVAGTFQFGRAGVIKVDFVTPKSAPVPEASMPGLVAGLGLMGCGILRLRR